MRTVFQKLINLFMLLTFLLATGQPMVSSLQIFQAQNKSACCCSKDEMNSNSCCCVAQSLDENTFKVSLEGCSARPAMEMSFAATNKYIPPFAATSKYIMKNTASPNIALLSLHNLYDGPAIDHPPQR